MGGLNTDMASYGKSNYVTCSGELFAGTGTYSGAFFDNSKTKIRDFTDGTSNTILGGERGTKDSSKGSEWIGTTTGNGYDLYSVTNTGTQYLINSTNDTAFSSVHVGGCHFVFGDGRVRFLSENIDATTYRQLGGKADGFTIGEY